MSVAGRSPKGLFLFLAAVLTLLGAVLGARNLLVMPGRVLEDVEGQPTPEQTELAIELRRHVEELAIAIGPRHAGRPAALDRCVLYLESELGACGPGLVRESYTWEGQRFHNLILDLKGTSRAREIVVIGAHYDTVQVDEENQEIDCPGADDNASGVAAVLALARRFAERPQARTLRFVLYPNEEEPFFGTLGQGSVVNATESSLGGEDVVAMLSLETLGYYVDAPDTQDYPAAIGWLYPDRGNFVAFVGNVSSRSLLRRAVRAFRRTASIPSHGAALPGFVPGVSWSDHRSYWEEGVPALMVTDTAFYRNPHYHTAQDTPDRLDFERMARAVDGLVAVVQDLGS